MTYNTIMVKIEHRSDFELIKDIPISHPHKQVSTFMAYVFQRKLYYNGMLAVLNSCAISRNHNELAWFGEPFRKHIRVPRNCQIMNINISHGTSVSEYFWLNESHIHQPFMNIAFDYSGN